MPPINHRRMTTDAADEASIVTGRRYFYDTAGDDKIAGSDGNDFFVVSDGGDDVLRGGGGDDGFLFFETFTSADRVNGGDGIDTIKLSGFSDDYVLPIELDFNKINKVERFVFRGGAEYFIVVGEGFNDLAISNKRDAGDIVIDASALTSGALHISSGSGDAIIIGGERNDQIQAGNGGDTLTGNSGADIFVYPVASVSRPEDPDLITDFSRQDSIRLPRIGVDYHIGASGPNIGDVIYSYDSEKNQTVLEIFTTDDDQVDMIVLLTGQHDMLDIEQNHFIVIA